MVTLVILNVLLQLHLLALSDKEELQKSQAPTPDQSTLRSERLKGNSQSSAPEQSSCAKEQSTSKKAQPTCASDQPGCASDSIPVPPAQSDPEEEPEPVSDASSSSTQSDSNQDDRKIVKPQKYVGNSFSLKFHKPSCPFARVMRKSRRVAFTFRKAAVDAGQRPCKYCLPPWWLSVEAKILNYDRHQTRRETLPQNK